MRFNRQNCEEHFHGVYQLPASAMSLWCMPCEVLEQIWSCRQLCHEDVLRLSHVCLKFQQVSLSNRVWKHKFSQRWPQLLEKYHGHPEADWRAEFIGRHTCGTRVLHKVSDMSAMCYQKEEVSAELFTDLVDLAQEDDRKIFFIIDALMAILHDGCRHSNLTRKYYASKTLSYMQHFRLRREWQAFLALPEQDQLLEKGAILVAQWCQPAALVSESHVVSQLDRLAAMVRDALCQVNLEHPACRTEEQMPSHLSESLMSASHSRTALEALNRLLFTELGFHGNEDDYYEAENSYIDQVLERKLGIPISLATVYISIARRLGVRCDAVNFPHHFLVKFKEHPDLPEDQAYTYVDVFNKGRFLTARDCFSTILKAPGSLTSNQELLKAVPTVNVMQRMVRNLVNIGRQQGQMGDGLYALRNAVELHMALCPDDPESAMLLARLHMHLRINIDQVVEMLETVSSRLGVGSAAARSLGMLMLNARMLQEDLQSQAEEMIVPQLRSEHWRVHHSVGLIMQHKKYNYICVISGWDEKCQASQEWMLQMSVHTLENQGRQPFYNVLVDDGSNRYAAQENLVIADEPKPVSHREVGKYFEEFCGTHYMPNHQKNQEYPEDLAKTLEFVTSHYGG